MPKYNCVCRLADSPASGFPWILLMYQKMFNIILVKVMMHAPCLLWGKQNLCFFCPRTVIMVCFASGSSAKKLMNILIGRLNPARVFGIGGATFNLISFHSANMSWFKHLVSSLITSSLMTLRISMTAMNISLVNKSFSTFVPVNTLTLWESTTKHQKLSSICS